MIDRIKDFCLVVAVLASLAVASCPGLVAFVAGLIFAAVIFYVLSFLSPYR